jgi:NADPH:quinone reductase-like Zn-dependent oxidoreductase
MTTRILRHDRFGPPAEVLRLVEEPDAVPRVGEVAIRVEAAPIHTGDLQNIAGVKLMLRHVQDGNDLHVPLPQVPGIEGVGRIDAVGPGVTRWRVGDRVYLPRQCGSWRTRLLADEAAVLPCPDGDATQLSQMVNAFSAEFALTDLAPLQRGDWFLQNGANSSVGRLVIQLARRRGIRTLNVVRRAELVPELEALGADRVLVDGPDLAARVRATVGGAPLMIALDGVAGAATGRLAECLSDGGTIANMGTTSGEPCAIPTWVLLYRRIRLIGYYAGYHMNSRAPAERARIMGELAALLGSGALRSRIAATYPLEQYATALQHAARAGAERDGKVTFLMQG